MDMTYVIISWEEKYLWKYYECSFNQQAYNYYCNMLDLANALGYSWSDIYSFIHKLRLINGRKPGFAYCKYAAFLRLC